MRLALLTDNLEASYWQIVKQDYCDYYFFIYDWLLQRDRTQVFLALEQDAVVGLMLIYDGSIVQLRGEPKAVSFLLENVQFGFVELQAPIQSEQVVKKKFSQCKLKSTILLMSVQKGEEHLSIGIMPEKLSVKDAAEVALLMHECYPEMWGSITAENVRQLLSVEGALWLGIKQNNELVAFGYALLTPKVSHVTWVATKPQFQNRGYATSIVSALVKECLDNASTAIIYVMDNNTVAKSVYSKVGFKPYKSYIFIKT